MGSTKSRSSQRISSAEAFWEKTVPEERGGVCEREEEQGRALSSARQAGDGEAGEQATEAHARFGAGGSSRIGEDEAWAQGRAVLLNRWALRANGDRVGGYVQHKCRLAL